MTESQASSRLPLGIRHTTPAERRSLLRFSLLSALMHATVLAALLAWTGGRAKTSPPVQIITVDLNQVEHRPQALPPKVQLAAGHAPERVRPSTPALRAPAPAVAPTASNPPVVSSLPSAPAASPPPNATAPAAEGQTASPKSTASIPTGPTATTAPVSPGSNMPVTSPTSTSHLSSPPARSGADQVSLRTGYMQRCRRLIEHHKEYPVMARRGRMEGTVIVFGTLTRGGSLRHCIIKRSSGSGLLDNAAVRAVQSVGTFPPMPAELHGNELTFELPISFSLTGD